MDNLKRVKVATKAWALEKRVRDEKEFLDMEHRLKTLMMDGDGHFSSEARKKEIVDLEERRMVLLGEKEVLWRLKSRAFWLKGGDENTKLFQSYAKGRQMGNIIWEGRHPGQLL